jgi:N6-L-threonylcarbamoyladenine synthase
MYLLAFETSCDDTSVALMRDRELLSMSTRTQLEHDATWGVVPEVAARSHANAIFPCIEDVLSQAWVKLQEIDYFACTEKPGLLPSLLTGLTVAKTFSLAYKKPLILIDHIESHIFANFLERNESEIIFPAVVLTVSGGHTEIYLWKSIFELEMVGQTRDDAAGECFDKVAKMMWLGFPWWAKIAQLSQEYRESWFMRQESWKCLFPEVMLERDSLDFSFSGLKTAVKREVDRRWDLALEDQQEIAYEVEETITDILSKKLRRALDHTSAHMMLLAGWVSANTLLKAKLQVISSEKWIPFLAPIKTIYSMDNAAMVGIRSYFEIQHKSL